MAISLADYKRSIPLILCFIFGILYAFEWYIDIRVGDFSLSYYLEHDMLNYFNAMYSVAIGIGAINIFRIHYRRFTRRRKYWEYSLLVLILIPVMAVISVFGGRWAIDPKGVVVPRWVYDSLAPTWNFLYWNIMSLISQTMFSLLGFFIISAGYRAFRARNIDSIILLISGILVVLGQAPINASVWPGFETIKNWLMDVPNVAGRRGILLGAAIGALAYGVRVIFWYERRPTLAGGE